MKPDKEVYLTFKDYKGRTQDIVGTIESLVYEGVEQYLDKLIIYDSCECDDETLMSCQCGAVTKEDYFLTKITKIN